MSIATRLLSKLKKGLSQIRLVWLLIVDLPNHEVSPSNDLIEVSKENIKESES